MKGGGFRKKTTTDLSNHQLHHHQDEDETPPQPPPTRRRVLIDDDDEEDDDDDKEDETYEGEEAAEEEEEEEEDEDENNNNNAVVQQQEEETSKLAEGFYEIEDVRRKRIRKGQLQYLIKWKGWSEAANTWEPVDNLQACSDIIAAFEHRSVGTSRRRKRKHNVSFTQPKKKHQQRPTSTSTSSSPSTQPTNNSFCHSNLPPLHHPRDGSESADYADKDSEHRHRVDHLAENGSTNISVSENHNETIEANPPNDGLDGGKYSVQVPDTRASEKEGGSDEQSKVGAFHTGRFAGAKRRKSGRVQRFTQDLPSNGFVEPRHPGPKTTYVPAHQSQTPNSSEHDARDENNVEKSVNPSAIIRIIKPLGYSASLSNNVHDVSVNFRVMRSDGLETVVDNTFLKVNNPLLLINFYEKHLRYTPPT